MLDASEFHNVKLNVKEVISPKLVTIPKKRRWTLKIYWSRSGSENSNLDKVPSKFEEKFKRDLLGESDGFPPTDHSRKSLHINTVNTEISDVLSKIASKKYLGKLVMNFFNKQTYAVYYSQNKLLKWYWVYRRRLHCQACLLLHLRHHQRRMLKVRYQIQHQSNVRVRIDKHGETRS